MWTLSQCSANLILLFLAPQCPTKVSVLAEKLTFEPKVKTE